MFLSNKIQVLAILSLASVAFVDAFDAPIRAGNERVRHLKGSKADVVSGRTGELEPKEEPVAEDKRTKLSEELIEEITSRVYIGRPTILQESSPAQTPTGNVTDSNVPLAYANTQYNPTFSRPASTTTTTSSTGSSPYQTSGVNVPVGRPGSYLPPDTDSPTGVPSSTPSKYPTPIPTLPPTPIPTTPPTPIPTERPTPTPTVTRTPAPTTPPTEAPTGTPTKPPTPVPTLRPTPTPTTYFEGIRRPGATGFNQIQPTYTPVQARSQLPSDFPSMEPSVDPTAEPTDSLSPSAGPSLSSKPSIEKGLLYVLEDLPTFAPTTWLPTVTFEPTVFYPWMEKETDAPANSTNATSRTDLDRGSAWVETGEGESLWAPTPYPTLKQTSPPVSSGGSSGVSLSVSRPGAAALTSSPTRGPSASPSAVPSSGPTMKPTALPTPPPTFLPTQPPSRLPTAGPTPLPTTPVPTAIPTPNPTPVPTPAPTHYPTTFFDTLQRPGTGSFFVKPSSLPSDFPSMEPSQDPTVFDP
mmetsp:Transcript_16400/g.41117  ORF Transcript_16400/g.41117 Transcript_16400/m.41117 type:complete len:524 (+) Transcript_16400:153-1724(+)